MQLPEYLKGKDVVDFKDNTEEIKGGSKEK